MYPTTGRRLPISAEFVPSIMSPVLKVQLPLFAQSEYYSLRPNPVYPSLPRSNRGFQLSPRVRVSKMVMRNPQRRLQCEQRRRNCKSKASIYDDNRYLRTKPRVVPRTVHALLWFLITVPTSLIIPTAAIATGTADTARSQLNRKLAARINP
jgi:hypothetical protein